MKYEKLSKAYKFFFLLFCPFTSNLFVNVKLHNAALKTIVSAAAHIKSPPAPMRRLFE